MSRGRPPIFTDEIKARVQAHICEQIANGRSLNSILKNDEGMPSWPTVTGWIINDDDFAANYTRAREAQADCYADEIADIADTEPDYNRARVRIDARKWAAGKLKPKIYGDRLQLDGDLNVTLTDQQIESRLAQLLGKAGAVAIVGGKGTPEEAA